MVWYVEFWIELIGDMENLCGFVWCSLWFYVLGLFGVNVIDVLIYNFLLIGFLIEFSVVFVVGELIMIDLFEVGIINVMVVWKDGMMYGCEFDWLVLFGVVSVVMLWFLGEELGLVVVVLF